MIAQIGCATAILFWIMLAENEIKEALVRYEFLVELLYHVNNKTDEALKNDRRWFAIAPKIGIKFLNQAFTLKILFAEKELELPDQTIHAFEDLSAIYSTIRMQFEAYGLFYHLFIPCDDIEENILRFRLWELDGVRNRIKLNFGQTPEQAMKRQTEQQYQQTIEQVIQGLPYFSKLESKTQKFLLDKAAWRFSSASLAEKPLKLISYDQLIRQANVSEELFTDFYAYLSMHTHPSYVGVLQNINSTPDEITIGRYVAIMHASFATAFMIDILAKRFTQGKEHLASLKEFDRSVYMSVLNGGRDPVPKV